MCARRVEPRLFVFPIPCSRRSVSWTRPSQVLLFWTRHHSTAHDGATVQYVASRRRPQERPPPLREDSLIAALLDDDQAAALAVLADPSFDALAVSDPAGMTALHHAARGGHERVVRELLRRSRRLATVFTLASRTPGHWLPLHCVCDAPPFGDAQVRIVRPHISKLQCAYSSNIQYSSRNRVACVSYRRNPGIQSWAGFVDILTLKT